MTSQKCTYKPSKNCSLIKQYYNNKKLKVVYCKYLNLRIYFCKECGSPRIVWDKLDIVCKNCGLIHTVVDYDSDSERQDIPRII